MDFKTPDRVSIGGARNLQVDQASTEAPGSDLASELDTLIEQARIDLGLQPGEFDMFSVDVPDMPPSHAIVVAASAEVQKARRTERVMGICMPTPYVAPGSAPNVHEASMDMPNFWAREYLSRYEKVELGLPPMSSVEIVKAPVHARLVFDKSRGGEDALYFVPNPGYVGSDYAELRVTVEGRPVKLAYYIHVTKVNLDAPGIRYPQFCPKQPVWKISTPGPVTGNIATLDTSAEASLNALAAMITNSYKLGSLSVTIDSLDGQAVPGALRGVVLEPRTGRAREESLAPSRRRPAFAGRGAGN